MDSCGFRNKCPAVVGGRKYLSYRRICSHTKKKRLPSDNESGLAKDVPAEEVGATVASACRISLMGDEVLQIYDH